jgi:ribose 5-phosphate isomerase B
VKIALGCDHRGFSHKEALSKALQREGHVVTDFGSFDDAAADYPDAAIAVAEAVAQGICARGILICGSGIGMSIAANKVDGVRASLCLDEDAARQTVAHNDSNVLCLSGDRTSPEHAVSISRAWLTASFTGGRHARRVNKILAYEAHRHECDT